MYPTNMTYSLIQSVNPNTCMYYLLHIFPEELLRNLDLSDTLFELLFDKGYL